MVNFAPEWVAGFTGIRMRLTCLKNGKIDINENKLGDWTKKEASKYLIKNCDFLIARGNGSKNLVGRGGLVSSIKFDVAFPDTLIRARFNSDLAFPKYIALVWDSSIIRTQIELSARTSAGIFKINQKIIEKLYLPLPPLEEQKQIVKEVDKLFALADKVEARYQQAKARVDKLSQSVLAKAFRGELVPQDPNDEPAEKLLERILEEKAKMEVALKGAKKRGTKKTVKKKSGSKK